MSKIEWTGKTWNPVRGCSRVSPGCDHCYAMGQAHRFSGKGKPYEGLTTLRRGKVDWSGSVRFVPEMLDVPLRTRKPTTFFVNSMSDLFHGSIPDEQIAAVFGVMAACPQHTFQVLTKRAERLPQWFRWMSSHQVTETCVALYHAQQLCEHKALRSTTPILEQSWPLPNVHLGISAEDQERYDARIAHLVHGTPAAVHFVSLEPLLGPIDLRATGRLHLDWVIVGGESGPGARLADLAHHRAIIEQCKAAGVPVFHKQAGSNVIDSDYGLQPLTLRSRKGGEMSEWREDLRVREMPNA